MKNIFAAGAVTLALAFVAVQPQTASAHDRRPTPPAVPDDVAVRDGSVPFLEGHATGTQNYVCLPSGATFAWTLFTPQATLFDDHRKQIITHFFGPNPDEDGTIRAAWEDSRDTSTVWAAAAGMSTDPRFVKQGAIAWVLLDTKGVQEGPTGGARLTVTTHIQRVNTVGGAAPATGCAQLSDVGRKAFVPYKADYFFYRAPDADDDEDAN